MGPILVGHGGGRNAQMRRITPNRVIHGDAGKRCALPGARARTLAAKHGNPFSQRIETGPKARY